MASPTVDRVALANVRHLHNSPAPDAHSACLEAATARALIEAMRRGLEVAPADVLCALDAIGSVARARRLELTDVEYARFGRVAS